jgi:hypothetical protein
VRTTVDIDPRLLAKAKQLAAEQGRTLGAVVGEALSAYLASRSAAVADPPFKLLVRGRPHGRFPTPADVAAIEEEDEVAALAILRKGRRAAP